MISFHIIGWIEWIRTKFATSVKTGFLYLFYSIYLQVYFAFTHKNQFGHNIFEDDWDLIIILDACRVDILERISNEFSFLGEIETIWSVGSSSGEWMANTFIEKHLEEIKNTTYISANGHSKLILEDGICPPVNNEIPVKFLNWSTVDQSELKSHEQLFNYKHNPKYKTVLPQSVSNKILEAVENSQSRRIIAHYIQPHLPYVADAIEEEREPNSLEKQGYRLLRFDEAMKKEILSKYEDNLRFVLDDIRTMLRAVEIDKIVLTADHGESFGEGHLYGHPEGNLHPTIRKVPWVELDTKNLKSEQYEQVTDGESVDISEHLQDLGYS